MSITLNVALYQEIRNATDNRGVIDFSCYEQFWMVLQELDLSNCFRTYVPSALSLI